MMKSYDKRLLLAIAGLTFLGILLLNLLTPLLADDYMYAFRFDTGTRLETVAEIFPSLGAHARTINGRLTPHFFVQLFTLLPRPVFGVINALMYMTLLWGIYTLAASEAARFDWKLFLIIDGAVFLLPPSFGQSFLWLAGSVNYLWCDTLMVWLFVPFADALFRRKALPGAGKTALMAAGALLMGNMSENVSASAALMMGLCILWQAVKRRKTQPWMWLSAGLTVLGWAALMLVPANRQSVTRSVSGLAALFNHYRVALDMWMAHGLWPSLTFIALFFWVQSRAGADRDRLAFSMGLFICSLLCNFVMAASDYYPDRAFTGSAVFLILAFVTVLKAPGSAETWVQPLANALSFGLALVLAVQMVNAIPSAYNRYRLNQARITEVCEARDSGVTDVTTFGINGNTRFDAFYGLHELTTAADYFPNVYYAKYYGLHSVVVDHFQ